MKGKSYADHEMEDKIKNKLESDEFIESLQELYNDDYVEDRIYYSLDDVNESLESVKMSDVTKSIKSINKVKSRVNKAVRSKERLRTVSHYLCDRCDKLITDPEDGFVIQGNIYVADTSCRGGLIGNNFPLPEEPGKKEHKFEIDEVDENVFCKWCLNEVLNLNKKKDVKRSSVKKHYNDLGYKKTPKEESEEGWSNVF